MGNFCHNHTTLVDYGPKFCVIIKFEILCDYFYNHTKFWTIMSQCGVIMKIFTRNFVWIFDTIPKYSGLPKEKTKVEFFDSLN